MQKLSFRLPLEVGWPLPQRLESRPAVLVPAAMSYDEVEIEDMEWREDLKAFTYPCPCGDLFQITKAELSAGEEIARCPSCSLYITVIYNPEDFEGEFLDSVPTETVTQPIAVA